MDSREKMFLRMAGKNRIAKESSWEAIREAAIVKKIRRKYTVSQEFSILRNRDTKPERFAEYFSYVESCISEADEEIANGVGDG